MQRGKQVSGSVAARCAPSLASCEPNCGRGGDVETERQVTVLGSFGLRPSDRLTGVGRCVVAHLAVIMLLSWWSGAGANRRPSAFQAHSHGCCTWLDGAR
jgi:hypothetical protein